MERFAFKNPKKVDNQKAELPVIHKRYTSFGTRGKPVKALTKSNCTEDEMFIFNFLEQKRKQAALVEKNKISKALGHTDVDNDEENYELKEGEVDDDEFEEYLDGFFGKKAKAAAEDEEELDFLKDLGGELKTKSHKKDKTSRGNDEDNEDIDDWNGNAEDDGDMEFSGEEGSDDDMNSVDGDMDGEGSDEGSISLKDSDSEIETDKELSDAENDSFDEIPSKKMKKSSKDFVDSKKFANKLKNSNGEIIIIYMFFI